MAPAVDRDPPTGAVLGRDERITAVRALQLFLGSPHDPGGAARRVAPGAPADLVLLAVPLAQALADLSAPSVRRPIHHAERAGTRSEERRVGKDGVSPCRPWWAPGT